MIDNHSFWKSAVLKWAVWSAFGTVIAFAAVPIVQDNPSPPKANRAPVRVAVKLVPVAVSVLDKDGRPVADLTAADFRLYDNGRLQEVRHFSRECLTADPAGRDEPVKLTRSQPRELAKPGRRNFLVLIGRGGVTDPFDAMNQVIRFVRERLLPQDRAAVMAWGRATAFTTDHEHIASVLERYRQHRGRIEIQSWKRFQGNALAAIYGSPAPPEAKRWLDEVFGIETAKVEADTSEASTGAFPAYARERAAAVRPGLGDPLRRGQLQGMPRCPACDPFDLIQIKALTDLPLERFLGLTRLTDTDLLSLFSAVAYLRCLDGERHLIFLSDQGLFLPRLDRDGSLAAVAADARVEIHALQTGGMDSPFESGSLISDRGWQYLVRSSAVKDYTYSNSCLRQLAEQTGGQVAVHTDINPALERIDATSRCFYLLGYDPAGCPWDGKFHRISVEVARPGVNVTCRQGYYASETPRAYDAVGFLSYSRIAAAAGSPDDAPDVKFKTDLTMVKDATGNKAHRLLLTIDPAELALAQANGEWRDSLNVVVFFKGESRRLGCLWHTVDVVMGETDYQRSQTEGVRISMALPDSFNPAAWRAVVYDAGRDKVGSRATGAFREMLKPNGK